MLDQQLPLGEWNIGGEINLVFVPLERHVVTEVSSFSIHLHSFLKELLLRSKKSSHMGLGKITLTLTREESPSPTCISTFQINNCKSIKKKKRSFVFLTPLLLSLKFPI